MLIRVNDVVEVITGRDAGQRGKVLKVNRADGKVMVEDPEGLQACETFAKKSTGWATVARRFYRLLQKSYYCLPSDWETFTNRSTVFGGR